jgi:DNA-binding LytR/AlgR family response regulator
VLSVLVVDDEVPALEELTFLLRRDPRVKRAVAASDPAAALRDLSRMRAAGDRLDAVFLDVRMPGLDGLDFSRLLAGFARPPAVVFVTAHDDFAVAAFELGALDYLLKPVRQERLAEAIRRVAAAVQRREAAEAGGAPPPHADETIPVELAGRTRLVSRSAVYYAEAHGDYVRLHTTEGKKYLVRMPLAALARRWRAAGFIRIHRSTLVSADHISEVRFDEGRAVVQVGGTFLPVSRRHTREVRDLLVRRFRSAGDEPCDAEDAEDAADEVADDEPGDEGDRDGDGCDRDGDGRDGHERHGRDGDGGDD